MLPISLLLFPVILNEVKDLLNFKKFFGMIRMVFLRIAF